MRQSTSQFRNLSSPNRIGATVKPIRSSQNAWNTGFEISVAVVAVVVAAVGRVMVAMGDLLLTPNNVDFRRIGGFRQPILVLESSCYLDRVATIRTRRG